MRLQRPSRRAKKRGRVEHVARGRSSLRLESPRRDRGEHSSIRRIHPAHPAIRSDAFASRSTSVGARVSRTHRRDGVRRLRSVFEKSNKKKRNETERPAPSVSSVRFESPLTPFVRRRNEITSHGRTNGRSNAGRPHRRRSGCWARRSTRRRRDREGAVRRVPERRVARRVIIKMISNETAERPGRGVDTR